MLGNNSFKWVAPLVFCCLATVRAAPRKSFAGLFGKTAFINTSDVTPSITEGEVLAITYGSALKDEFHFPWEMAVYSSMVFGQSGKSKFSLVPRFQGTWLDKDFKPFAFSVGLGAGFSFLFLRVNNYGGFISQTVIATDVDLGHGVSIGGESVIEIPLTNSFQNPTNISVLFRVIYRDETIPAVPILTPIP